MYKEYHVSILEEYIEEMLKREKDDDNKNTEGLKQPDYINKLWSKMEMFISRLSFLAICQRLMPRS